MLLHIGDALERLHDLLDALDCGVFRAKSFVVVTFDATVFVTIKIALDASLPFVVSRRDKSED